MAPTVFVFFITKFNDSQIQMQQQQNPRIPPVIAILETQNKIFIRFIDK
jgi:hypothetical protein